jgi:hypothetical protein
MAGRCETSEVTYIVLGMNSAHSESAVSKGPAHEPKCGGRLSTAYVVLSTKTRFRGTVMAQTSIRRLAQPCGAEATSERNEPANEPVHTQSSPGVVVPDSA